MVDAKFQKAYEAKIVEFKDTFQALKTWKENFSSTEEFEAELLRIKQSINTPPVVESPSQDPLKIQLVEHEKEIQRYSF
jgi:hypothetical protein